MITLLLYLLRLLPFLCDGRRQLALENLALRQQLAVYKRMAARPKLRTTDRLFWVWLAKVWGEWKQPLLIVTPDTVLRWQRRRFCEYWTRLSARPTGGRPAVNAEIEALVRRMAATNPLWGAPRIHGELLKLGIDVAERTVSRLMPKRCPAPSQTWRTFLTNHIRDLVSIDFFTVPAARLRVLFVFVVLAHHRRRVLHFNVTEHPTAAWTAQQILDAFPDNSAPSYLLRDRDSVYGYVFRQRVKGMGVGEVLTAPHSPWQNPFAYYHRARTHLSLAKDAPHGRRIERPELGRVFPIREVGGLHHRYVPTGRLIQPSRFATISPVLPSGCSPPHPKRSASFSGGPTDLLAAPPVWSLLAFLGLSRKHRPSSTEWDEVLAKDRAERWDAHYPSPIGAKVQSPTVC